MFPMTITLNSDAEVQAVMAALRASNAYAQAKDTHTDPKPALPEGDIRVAMGKPAGTTYPAVHSQVIKANVIAPEAAPTATSSVQEPAVDFQTVKVHILTLSKKRGTPAAVQLLERFKAKRVSDLREDQYRDVLAAAAEALADKEAA